MSTRAWNFMHKWLHDNIDEAPPEPVSASEMADRLIADAVKAGIPAKEIEDDAGSVFELVFAAIEGRREGG